MQIRTEDRPGAPWWTPRWWAQDARWLALAAPGLVFAGHALYGAMLPKTALTLAFVSSLLLMVALATPKVRREFDRIRDLKTPAALFIAVVGVAFWSLTPIAPGGPHPVWSYADAGAGAATVDKSQTLLEILKLLGLGAVFSLGLATGSSDGRARTAAQLVVALGAIVAAWSFLDWATGDLGGARRLRGPFEAANTAATLFGSLLVMTLGVATSVARTAPQHRRFTALAPLLAAGLLFLFCLVATASRGGLIATATGVVSFVALQLFAGQARWTRATLGFLAGLILLSGAILVAGDLLVDRLIHENLEQNGRRLLFQAHWDAFKGAPWMGYGLGSFDTVNRLILTATNINQLWSARAAHSVYLTWFEQAGVLGAAPMFICIATVLWLTARNTLRRKRLVNVLHGLLAANLVFLVHGAFDFALETYSVAALWSLILGLQFAASQGSRPR